MHAPTLCSRYVKGLAAALVLLVAEGAAAASPPLLPLSRVVPDVMPGDLELTVIPHPREQELGDRLLDVGTSVLLIVPEPDALRAGYQQLQLLFADPAAVSPSVTWPEDVGTTRTLVVVGGERDEAVNKGAAVVGTDLARVRATIARPEGYVLQAGRAGDGTSQLILIVGTTPQARFWGIQSLRQLTFRRDDGRVFVRSAAVFDWPAFELRGCKRAQLWEHAVKANFRYSTMGGASIPLADVDRDGFAAHFMTEWIPDVQLGRELDCSERTVAELEQSVRSLLAHGATGICLHQDDQPMKLAADTAERFDDDYEAAMAWLVRRLHEVVRKQNATARVFLIVQPYWTSTRYELFARALQAGDGVPADIGLILCGPEVTSFALPPDDIRRYREAFGLTQTKAIVYDNYLRSNCFRAIDRRPASLSNQLYGVSTETGSASSRITRLDWAWNPGAYDEERSLMLACREIGGLQAWPDLYAAVHLAEGRLPLRYDSQEEALARWADGAAELQRRLADLAASPARIAGRIRLPAPKVRHTKHQVRGALDDLALFRRALTAKQLDAIREVGVAGATADGGVPPDALVAHWPFDDKPADADLSGGLGGGGVKNRADLATVPGRVDNAIRFVGDGALIEVPARDDLELAAFTICCWTRVMDTGNYQVIMRKAGPDRSRNYSLIISRDGGTPYTDIYPVPGAGAKTRVVDGEWHFLAATCDGRTSRMYVDGRKEGETPTSRPLVRGAGPLHIGAMPLPEPESMPRGFAYDILEHLRTEAKAVRDEEATPAVLANAFMFARAVRAPRPPVIDGSTDETAWTVVPPVGDFAVAHNGEIAPLPKQSTFRVCYDDLHLYVAVESLDPDMPGEESLDRQGMILNDGLVGSRVKLLLDPGRTRRQCYEFAVDRNGTLRDGWVRCDSDAAPQGRAFDSGARHAVAARAGGWRLEMAVPLASLGGGPKPGDVWGLNVWVRKHRIPPLIWSNKIWWWGFLDVSQAGNLRFE